MPGKNAAVGRLESPRILLITTVSAIAAVNLIVFAAWYRRTHRPGELIRRAFEIGLINTADGRSGLRKPTAPPEFLKLHVRHLPLPAGMRVTAGGYSFAVPPGTRRIDISAFTPLGPAHSGTATYLMPAGKPHRARCVHPRAYYSPPPGMAYVAVGGRSVYLVPLGAISITITLSRSSAVSAIGVRTPVARFFVARAGLLPREILRALLTVPGGAYIGFTMKRWCDALVQCGVKPAAADAVMRRIIDQHLDRETDLQIGAGVLRATWGQLERQTRLSEAVWKGLELQLCVVPRAGRAIWVRLPEGRTMMLYSGELFVFNRAGKATLEGSARWRHGRTPGYLRQDLIPFFAQAPPPGLWRVEMAPVGLAGARMRLSRKAVPH